MTDINQIMQQAKEMQEKIMEMQSRLGDLEITGESGGGMIKITIDGKGDMKNAKIAPSAIDLDDMSMVEDLIVAAFNDAKRRADKQVQEQTQNIMEQMGVPPGAMGGL